MDSKTFRFKEVSMRILENEHVYLTHLMNEWHSIVLNFDNRMYTKDEALAAIKVLRKLIKEFIDPWKNHCEKEEKFFFPLLGLYIGKEQGPIVTIEAEHAEIDGYIGHFLHHTLNGIEEMTLEDMTNVVKDAGEAYEVLMVHFVKEESVLFPMTERVMKAVDQEKLTEQLKTKII
ncbi:hemerythrin domain-containing protein [Bacillus sp. FJAT-49711]|uniref:hemerythrin domain-containing protein n=1 Tax=Bacillus sp. FJAT-49711 TaxID=2833585 RepID=UPI001BC9048D|nr:hemerythrin domain-containing protein [Bacillus sp. FJAT-49711]MBS4216815.1 hemerythrin domain-containing protein [Bacillus sp. FJAT-49711]